MKYKILGLFISGLLTACGGATSSPPDTDTPPETMPPDDNNLPPDDNNPPDDASPDNNPPPSGNAGDDLVLSEVVAKSDDDDFVAGNDWIELHNPGTQTITLNGFALADSNSDVIPLPDLNLEAGQYIVIAAVDSDDENPPSPSVPFKLGKEDSVTLYFDGQMLDTLAWVDGDAPGGTSYGILDNILQTLTPTPGAANEEYVIDPVNQVERGNPSNDSALKISEVVAKSDRPDFHNESDWIELVNTGDSAIDLSQYGLGDDSNDVEYLPQVTLEPGEYFIVPAGNDTDDTAAAQVSFGLGREDSVSLFHDTTEVDYVAWGRDESKNGRGFGRVDGELQLVYPTPGYDNVPYVLFTQEEVYTVRVDIPTSDWQAILADPQAEQYYPASLEFNGAVIDNVGFRIKGQGSLMFIGDDSKRYGFKVDINEYQDQKFMGMKKLVLNQSFADPSYMRDVLSYKIMREAGVPAPETSYVELWVAGEHMGLYQLVEMIDSEFVERHFPQDHETTGKGDMYKGELGQRLTWVDNNIASYSDGLRLKLNKETIGTPEEGEALLRFLDSINNGDDKLAHIHTDLMVKYLAASVLVGNMDSPIGGTANNFYLYEQRSEDRFTILPWDYNLAFGMWGDGPAVSIGGGGFGGGFGGGGFGGGFGETNADCDVLDHVIDNPVHDTNDSRPMLDAILADPQLKQQYHEHLQTLLDTAYNPDYLEAEIMRIAELIDPYVQADPTKFFTYQEWRMSLTQDLPEGSDISNGRGAGTYGPAPGLTNFIRERADIVQRQLNGDLPSSNNGGNACPPGQ